jgi:Ni/Fe-hydrogenase 1 B-type cytochrome subunit
MTVKQYQSVKVWDAPTRLFHWVNVVCVLLLVFLGFTMMYSEELGFSGWETKLALKQYHAAIGYVFVTNLLIRFAWAFLGNAHARWRAFLPGRDSRRDVLPYIRDLFAGHPRQYVGHTPAGRVAITLLYAMMLAQALTGMVRAGTDLYYPPFGGLIAGYVANPGVDPATLRPGKVPEANPEKYERVKAMRGKFGEIHIFGAYILIFLAVIHIIAVVITERYKGGIVSAMISGRKMLDAEQPPADAGKT